MRQVRLGETELQVSPIAFGTWSFGGDRGRFDRDEAEVTIGRALELGITLFDSARGYPPWITTSACWSTGPSRTGCSPEP